MIPEGWLLEHRSWHFHRRLWEHYGVRLGYGEYTAVMTAIRRGEALPLSRDGAKYKAKLRCGAWIKVVVGKHGQLITTLPWGVIAIALRHLSGPCGDEGRDSAHEAHATER
jgi:hypothetical protein